MSRTKTAPIKKEVSVMSRCVSPINMFMRGRIQSGYTLFPGVLTNIPKDDWEQLMINPAVSGLVDQEKILVVNSSTPNILPEHLNEKVSVPELPVALQEVEVPVWGSSLISPAEVGSVSELKIKEQIQSL